MSQAPRCKHGGVERGLLCEKCHGGKSVVFNHGRPTFQLLPKSEETAKQETEEAFEDWEDYQKQGRRELICDALILVGVIGFIIQQCHRHWLEILNFLF